MKRVLLALALTLGFATTSVAQQKVGHINVDELLAVMPETQAAQAEIQKSRVQAQKAVLDAETNRMKIIMDDDRQRDEAEADIRIKAAELAAKYGTQVDIAEINALMERDRETIRQVAKVESQGLFDDDFNSAN